MLPRGGGGINVWGVSNILFDCTDRCSIYENYAGYVNDILCADTGSIIDVYLDMLTVYPNTKYYINYFKSSPNWFGNFGIVDIQRGYRTEVNHDLYLSPNGNDANDGLSLGTPKKTIAKALHTIASDSLDAKTIYLAPGTYSSEGGQIYPLNLKAYVNLIGDSLSFPILINQRYEETINSVYANNKTIANLVIEHGNHTPISVLTIDRSNNTALKNITINPVNAITFAGLSIFQSKCELENIRLNGLSSIDNSGLVFQQSSGSIKNLFINDCHNTGNEDQSVHSTVYVSSIDSLLVMENISITNCSVSSTLAGIFGLSDSYSDNPVLRMSDVLIANNTSNGLSPILITHIQDSTAYLSNCSFVNNSGTTIAAKISGKFNISNCIFDNYNATEISIRDIQTSGSVSHIDFNNNLIEGYPTSVYVHPSNDVTFNEYNFSADPGFMGTDWTNPLSYRLNSNSPCIDTGTPDTTGLFLPLTDLFGNPRIYNGIIDIGCYEWDGIPNEDSNIPIPDTNTLSIYPNPFKANTNICFILSEKGDVKLDIFNVKGQKVISLCNGYQSKGMHKINWNGTGNTGKALSSGVYFASLSYKGKQITQKMIMMK